MTVNPSTPICFVDTETTSLDPNTRVAWEVALIRREPDGTERKVEFFVELTNRELHLADPESMDIGGFDLRYDPISARSKRTAGLYVSEFTDGAVIIGACPDFDTHNLSILMAAAGLKPNWHHRLVDIRTLAWGYLLCSDSDYVIDEEEKAMFPVDGSVMREAFGITIDPEDEHTAMGDAMDVRAMYDAIMEDSKVG